MPISLCEWRVRIGRFVQWMREYEIIERKEKALKERTRLLKVLHERLLKKKENSAGAEDECETKINNSGSGETDDQSGSKITISSNPNEPLRQSSCPTQSIVKESNTPAESTTKNTKYKINSAFILVYLFSFLLLFFFCFLFSLDDFLNLLENCEPLLKWSHTSFSDWIWLIGIISCVSTCIIFCFAKKNMEESQGTWLEILHKKTRVESTVKENRNPTISTVKVNNTPSSSTTKDNRSSAPSIVRGTENCTEPAFKVNNGYSKSTKKESNTAKRSIIKENNATTKSTDHGNNTKSHSTLKENTIPNQPKFKEDNTLKKVTTKINTSPQKPNIKQNSTLKHQIKESNTAKKSANTDDIINRNQTASNSTIDEISTPIKSATKEKNARKKSTVKNNHTPTDGKQSAIVTKFSTKKHNAGNRSSIRKNNAKNKSTIQVDITSKKSVIKDNGTPTQSTFKVNDKPTQSTIKDNGTPTQSTIKDNCISAQSTIKGNSTFMQSTIKDNSNSTQYTIQDNDISLQSTIKDNSASTQSTIKDNDTSTQSTIKGNNSSTQSTIKDNSTPTQSTIKDNATLTQSTIKDRATPTQSIVKDKGTPTQSTIKDNVFSTQSAIKGNYTSTQSTIKDNGSSIQSAIKSKDTPTRSTIKDNETPTQYTIKDNSASTRSTIKENDTSTPSTIKENTSTQSTIKDNSTPTQSTTKDNATLTQSIIKDRATPTRSTIKDNKTPTQSTIKDNDTPTQSTTKDNATLTQSTIKDRATPTRSTIKDNETPTQSTIKDNDTPTQSTIKENATPTQFTIKGVGNPPQSTIKLYGSSTQCTIKDNVTPRQSTIKDNGTPTQSTIKYNGIPPHSTIKDNTPTQSTIKDNNTLSLHATIKDINTHAESHRKENNLRTGALVAGKAIREDYIRKRCASWTTRLLVQAGDVEMNPGPLERSIGALHERELLKLANDISSEYYYTLCIALGFLVQGENILTQNHEDFSKSAFQILCKWRMTQIDGSACRRDLVDILRREDLNELANKISEGKYYPTESVPTGEGTQPLTREQVAWCGEDFKTFYKTRLCKIKADPLDSNSLLEFERIYTNLVLLRNEMGKTKKIPLHYKNLLTEKVNGELPKRFMVEGEGGAGKTTFCSKMAWDWSHGEQEFQQFDWVLVIPLRDTEGNQTVGDIAKTYLSDSNPVQPYQIDEYILANPSKVFIIFDGLDEYNGDLVSQGTDIAKIIRSEKYTECRVLVTTRPWKADQIKSNTTFARAYAFIAVTGFDEELISIYINKYFSDGAKAGGELISVIANNDVIKENMAPFPIYIAMLCALWRDYDDEKREFIRRLKTFSQLFQEIIIFLKDHYVTKHHKDLNEEGITKALEQLDIYFRNIGQIALSGVMDKKLVFAKRDFSSCQEAMETCCGVGVISQENRVVRRRDRHKDVTHPIRSSVFFPHKLFQEYLAGVYLAYLFEYNPRDYKVKIDDLFEKGLKEFRYLLYFTASQTKKVGLDITDRLVNKNKHDSGYMNFLVDVTYEAYNEDTAKEVGHHAFAQQKSIEISDVMSAHTVSGYLFIMENKAMETLMSSRSSCGPTLSRELADIICSSTSLTGLVISGTTFHGDFYGILEKKIQASKLKHLLIERMDSPLPIQRMDPPYEVQSRKLARFVKTIPGLKDLTLRANNFHECFYSELASGTGSTEIKKLTLESLDLLKSQSASRDLARFLYLQPGLTDVNITGYIDAYNSVPRLCLHDEFYHEIADFASSSKIQNLTLEGLNLLGNNDPSAARDLARFLCLQPGLSDVKITGYYNFKQGRDAYVRLYDEFYHEIACLASSSKIQKLTLEGLDMLMNDPSASHDLATFLRLQPCLTDLKISFNYGRFTRLCLHNEFYHEIACFAPSSKIEKLTLNGLILKENNDPSASRDLARFLCLQPRLRDVKITGYVVNGRDSRVYLHDEFYHEIACLASSPKIQKLTLEGLNLQENNDPSASRDLARFLCLQPGLTDVKITGYVDHGRDSRVCLHDEFYHEIDRIASSSKSPFFTNNIDWDEWQTNRNMVSRLALPPSDTMNCPVKAQSTPRKNSYATMAQLSRAILPILLSVIIYVIISMFDK